MRLAEALEYVFPNIKYPKSEKEKGIAGMSIIRMVIEKDISVTNSPTLKGSCARTGAKADRYMSKLPKWVRGNQKGKTLTVLYTLPVKLKLEGDSDEKVEVTLDPK